MLVSIPRIIEGREWPEVRELEDGSDLTLIVEVQEIKSWKPIIFAMNTNLTSNLTLTSILKTLGKENLCEIDTMKMLGIVLICGLTTFNSAYCSEKLTVYTEQFYPFSYTEDGEDHSEVLGVATSLMLAVLEESGLDYELWIVPWSRALLAINRQNNVLVYSMARTADREDKYGWIGEIWQIKNFLYGQRAKKNSLPKTLADANSTKYKIAVIRDDIIHTYLRDRGFTNLIEVRDITRTFAMLQSNRVDLIPLANISAHRVADYGKNSDNIVPIIFLSDLSFTLYIAASKKMNPILFNRLTRAYQAIRDSGRYDEIMSEITKSTVPISVLTSP